MMRAFGDLRPGMIRFEMPGRARDGDGQFAPESSEDGAGPEEMARAYGHPVTASRQKAPVTASRPNSIAAGEVRRLLARRFLREQQQRQKGVKDESATDA